LVADLHARSARPLPDSLDPPAGPRARAHPPPCRRGSFRHLPVRCLL